MSTPMNKVSSLVSSNISNYLTNIQTWGGLVTNVKAYGALGDGVTDDTAAIQKAINSIGMTGGVVMFPEGTYLVSSPVKIIDYGISLIGSGIDVTTIKAITAMDSIIYFQNNPAVGNSGVGHTEVSGFLLDANNLATDAIYAYRYQYENVIQQLRIIKPIRHGIYFYQLCYGANTIRDCRINNCGDSAVSINFSSMAFLNNNYFADCANGVSVSGVSGNPTNGTSIENCLFERCSQNGVYATGEVTAMTITNNYFEDNLTAIQLASSSVAGTVILGNNIHGLTGSTVYNIILTSAKNTTIIGNTFYAAGTANINQTGNLLSFIANNRISNGATTLVTGSISDSIILTPIFDYPFAINNRKFAYVGFSAAPTSRTWARGDTIFNENADAGRQVGWICTVAGTPGTWEQFGQIGYRTSSGAPTVAPRQVGEEILDTTNGKWYKSKGTTTSDWVALN